MIINKLRLIIGILMAITVISCTDNMDKDKVYAFVGDSIIARWPVDETFPSQLVYNYGRSGAGISYIREMEGTLNGKDAVVVIGTNDQELYDATISWQYADDYLDAINRLTDRTVYLYSVLPREFHDADDVNDRIAAFNAIIVDRLDSYPRIVYIDVFDDFMHEGHINYQYYSDGLHLNSYGYDILASHLLKTIY